MQAHQGEWVLWDVRFNWSLILNIKIIWRRVGKRTQCSWTLISCCPWPLPPCVVFLELSGVFPRLRSAAYSVPWARDCASVPLSAGGRAVSQLISALPNFREVLGLSHWVLQQIHCHDPSAPNALPTGYILNRVAFIVIYLLDLNLIFPEGLQSYSNLSAVFRFVFCFVFCETGPWIILISHHFYVNFWVTFTLPVDLGRILLLMQ